MSLSIDPKNAALLVMDFQTGIVEMVATEKDPLLARTARLEGWQLGDVAQPCRGAPDRIVEQHAVRLVHVVRRARPARDEPGHRRQEGRLANAANPQVGVRDGQRVSGTRHVH